MCCRVQSMDDIIKILPRGVRFHPFDEEVIYHLDHKIINPSYTTAVMKVVNLNHSEPWVLLGMMEAGEKEIYVFGQHGKKYPTGPRIDQSTEFGFWKTTGKDKKILRAEELIGKRSTLVFYMGRAPHGEKTNWVMNEFRKEAISSANPPTQNEWVVARISYNGVMDGSERRNPFEKHPVPQLAIMSDQMPESPIMLDLVPDSQIMGLMDEGCLNFGLEEMMNRKQLLLDSDIVQDPVLEPSIIPDPVPESSNILALVSGSSMVLEYSPIMDFIYENYLDLGYTGCFWYDVGATSNIFPYSAVDYPKLTTCLNKDFEVMNDLPSLTDESELEVEDWFVVTENDKEKEMDGSDEECAVCFGSVKRRRI